MKQNELENNGDLYRQLGEIEFSIIYHSTILKMLRSSKQELLNIISELNKKSDETTNDTGL